MCVCVCVFEVGSVFGVCFQRGVGDNLHRIDAQRSPNRGNKIQWLKPCLSPL